MKGAICGQPDVKVYSNFDELLDNSVYVGVEIDHWNYDERCTKKYMVNKNGDYRGLIIRFEGIWISNLSVVREAFETNDPDFHFYTFSTREELINWMVS